MKRILNFFKSLFSDWGMDKWAHLGIGGLACAMITIALILAEHQVSPWRMLLFPLGGAVCVFIFSFFKEMIDTTGFSWKDILAAMNEPVYEVGTIEEGNRDVVVTGGLFHE